MKITRLPAYLRFKKAFEQKGYSRGRRIKVPVYVWSDLLRNIPNLDLGHYISGIIASEIEFQDVPTAYQTREFFLYTLSSSKPKICQYVQEHSEKFDKEFFKDYIETAKYELTFERDIFKYMPLCFVDEEMVACAMLNTVDKCMKGPYISGEEWFFTVYERKPELLTLDMYIIMARCFAEKRNGRNKLLEITPEEYRTSEYYLALCCGKNTPVMEDVPEDILTMEFLEKILKDSPGNICCFNEAALERIVRLTGWGRLKCWQSALHSDASQIKNIPLNDERIKFFLSLYGTCSEEYKAHFKGLHESYIAKKIVPS